MPMLLTLMLLASGCTTKPEISQLPPVAQARIPPLSSEARQPDAPLWCSPNCSSGLSTRIESWRQRMTQPE